MHACAQPGLSAAPLQFCMCTGMSVAQKAWGQHLHPPWEPVSLRCGGILASCERSLAAGGWHVVYTRVCELSQISQTRILTEPGHNQCSNIATQGFLRERQAKQRGRAGVAVPAAFTSPYLGFSAAKLVLATGPDLDYGQQNSPSQAALLLCRMGVLPCPAWWHVPVPCKSLASGGVTAASPHLLPISIASSGAATKTAKRDPSWQFGAASWLACGPRFKRLCPSSAQPLLLLCRRNQQSRNSSRGASSPYHRRLQCLRKVWWIEIKLWSLEVPPHLQNKKLGSWRSYKY